MITAMVNETKVHLRETTEVFSSQSDALSSKVVSLSTQTECLASSIDALSSQSNVRASKVTSLSAQTESLTSLTGMAKDMHQDIRQDQTLSLIVDKIPSNVKSTSPCMQLSEHYPMANSGYYWMITDHTGSPVSKYCFINSELNPASSCQQLA